MFPNNTNVNSRGSMKFICLITSHMCTVAAICRIDDALIKAVTVIILLSDVCRFAPDGGHAINLMSIRLYMYNTYVHTCTYILCIIESALVFVFFWNAQPELPKIYLHMI